MDEQKSVFDRQLREWSQTDPAIDEVELKRKLRDRISDRRPRPRMRLVLATAAAASLLATIIGIETLRKPMPPVVAEEPAVIHEVGNNVILVLREGGEPIYIATEPIGKATGDSS